MTQKSSADFTTFNSMIQTFTENWIINIYKKITDIKTLLTENLVDGKFIMPNDNLETDLTNFMNDLGVVMTKNFEKGDDFYYVSLVDPDKYWDHNKQFPEKTSSHFYMISEIFSQKIS